MREFFFFFQNYEYRQRGQCIAEQLQRILTHADIQRAFTNSFIMWEQSLIYTYIYVYFILKKKMHVPIVFAKCQENPSLILPYIII